MIERRFDRRRKPSEVDAGANLVLECLNDGVLEGVGLTGEIKDVFHRRPGAILFGTARVAANRARELLQHSRDCVT